MQAKTKTLILKLIIFSFKIYFDAVKLLEYLVPDRIIVSYNPCVGPSPRNKIFFSYQYMLMNYFLYQKPKHFSKIKI